MAKVRDAYELKRKVFTGWGDVDVRRHRFTGLFVLIPQMGKRSSNSNKNSARIVKAINMMKLILTHCTRVSRENVKHLDSTKTSIIKERF